MRGIGFAGGLLTGFAGGYGIGNTINKSIDDYKMQGLREQGMAEAKAARESAINDIIKTGGLAGAAPAGGDAVPAVVTAAPVPADVAAPMPDAAIPASTVTQQTVAIPESPAGGPAPSARVAPVQAGTPAEMPALPTAGGPGAGLASPFSVNGKPYPTREAAFDAATSSVPSVMDFFRKNAVPQIQEAMIQRGDLDGAEKWTKWSEGKAGEKAMKDWAGVYRAANMGDFSKAARGVIELYKQYDDGIDYVGHEEVKDEAGNITGFKVKTKDAAGNENERTFTPKDITTLGLSALSPPKLFELTYKKEAEAERARAESAALLAKEDRAGQRQLQRDGFNAQANYQRDRARAKDQEAQDGRRLQGDLQKISLTEGLKTQNLGAGERAKIDAKVDVLRESGLSDDTIKGMLPAIVGATGPTKKVTDPAELRARVVSDLTKSDPTFARKSPDEQRRRVESAMSIINDTPTGAGAAAVPNPFSSAPAAGATNKPAAGSGYYRDRVTGEIKKF